MKIAKEKVWADAEGNLVKDGDESAAVLVAAAGQNIPDALLEQYRNADKFFEDAAFDSNATQVIPKTIAPAKAEPPPTINMVDGDKAKPAPAPVESGPAPTDREEAMPKRRTRAPKSPVKKKK